MLINSIGDAFMKPNFSKIGTHRIVEPLKMSTSVKNVFFKAVGHPAAAAL